jgi:hypothetical protein
MNSSAVACSHCGKHGVGFKHCSVCKEASYCGVECQKAGWKQHKKSCAPPLAFKDVVNRFNAAGHVENWAGVLELEGHMEDLLLASRTQPDGGGAILSTFARAHMFTGIATDDEASSAYIYHAQSSVRLQERRIDLLGEKERFRDQGEAMCDLGSHLLQLDELKAWQQYEKARDLGAAHGFFSVECQVERPPQFPASITVAPPPWVSGQLTEVLPHSVAGVHRAGTHLCHG